MQANASTFVLNENIPGVTPFSFARSYPRAAAHLVPALMYVPIEREERRSANDHQLHVEISSSLETVDFPVPARNPRTSR